METFFCHYKGKKLLFFTLPPPFYSFTPENLHLLPFALPILIIQLPKSHRIVRGLWASPADFQKVITFLACIYVSMEMCLLPSLLDNTPSSESCIYILRFIFIFCIWVFAYMYVCVPCMCLVLVGARRKHWSPGTGVTGSCEPLCGHGNWTWFIARASECS